MRAAIESFERAIQLEPEYALARAGLATALAWFSVRFAYQKDALSWGKRAEEEALRTLAIDHDMAEAHFAIAAAAGIVYGRFDRGKLLTEVDEALRLDPTLDLAYASRARGLYHLGLFDAAQVAASKAIALNPDGNVETNRLLVVMSLFSGRFAEAAKVAPCTNFLSACTLHQPPSACTQAGVPVRYCGVMCAFDGTAFSPAAA